MDLRRTQFRRLAELDRLIRAGKYPNCTSFAEEWAVTAKTIQRDIEFLRDQLRAPLKFDRGRNGYFYTDKSFSLPMLDLNEGEVLYLLLAEQMAEQLRGTPVADSLEILFGKIRDSLSDKGLMDAEVFKRKFSFHGQPTRPINETVWTCAFRALCSDRVLRMVYRAAEAKEATTREVEPIHVACVEGEWYLVAYDKSRGGMRHFSISRIKSAEMTDWTCELRDFDPETYFANRFGRYIGGPDEHHNIVLRFDKSAAPWVMERQWHPRQTAKIRKDGSLILSFPAPALFEVKRWVLQWGSEVTVVKPTELRDEIKAEVDAMKKCYVH